MRVGRRQARNQPHADALSSRPPGQADLRGDGAKCGAVSDALRRGRRRRPRAACPHRWATPGAWRRSPSARSPRRSTSAEPRAAWAIRRRADAGTKAGFGAAGDALTATPAPSRARSSTRWPARRSPRDRRRARAARRQSPLRGGRAPPARRRGDPARPSSNGSCAAASRELLPRVLVPPQLEVGPAEAVEIRAVAGIDRERPIDQCHRLLEPLAALGQHVAEIVERLRVARARGRSPRGRPPPRARTPSRARRARRAGTAPTRSRGSASRPRRALRAPRRRGRPRRAGRPATRYARRLVRRQPRSAARSMAMASPRRPAPASARASSCATRASPRVLAPQRLEHAQRVVEPACARRTPARGTCRTCRRRPRPPSPS